MLQSMPGAEQAAILSARRRRRERTGDVERRAARAVRFVQMGELSAGRQALEGAEVAPGTRRTLDKLRDPVRRPPEPREPLPQAVSSARPAQAFILDDDLFLQNLRTSRRGAAAGPSGMNSDHLFPLLDSERDSMKFYDFASLLARGEVPGEVMEILRMGRITALSKPGWRCSWNHSRRHFAASGSQDCCAAVQQES